MKRYSAILALSLLLGTALCGQVPSGDLTLIRSRFLLAEGKNQEALALLNTGKSDPSNLVQWNLARARALRGDGQVADAIESLNSILTASPAVAYFELALCAVELKDYESAIRYLQKHLSCPDHFTELEIKKNNEFGPLEGNHSWNRLWQNEWYTPDETALAEARYLISKGHFAEAIGIIDGIGQASKVHAAALFEKGRALLGINLGRQARELFRESINLSRQNTRLLELMATFFDSASMSDLAAQVVNQLLLNDPTNPDYLVSRAIQRIETSSESVALNEIERLADAGISSTDLYFQAGLRFRKSDPGRAAEFLTHAIDAGTLDARYYYERGLLRCRNDKVGEGLDDLAMSLDINPNQPELYLLRGEFRYDAGDQEGACHDWKKAFEMGNGRAADLLAKHCK